MFLEVYWLKLWIKEFIKQAADLLYLLSHLALVPRALYDCTFALTFNDEVHFDSAERLNFRYIKQHECNIGA